MVEKRVPRHRAACSPSTPITVALGNLRNSSGGKRALAIAGTGAALTTIAATVPATTQENVAAASSVNTAQVVSSLVNKADLNTPVSAEKVSFKETSDVSVEVKNESSRSAAAAAASDSPAAAVDLSSLPPADSNIVAIAYKYIGTPYVWGGRSPGGFDCSGFVSYVYAQVGKQIPHQDRGIANAGKTIPLSALQPGDVVWRPGHVGIYVGNGQVIQAFMPGKPLGVAPLKYGGFVSGVRF